jgi:DNA repair exonuclease SbcCD ATPase subunit
MISIFDAKPVEDRTKLRGHYLTRLQEISQSVVTQSQPAESSTSISDQPGSSSSDGPPSEALVNTSTVKTGTAEPPTGVEPKRHGSADELRRLAEKIASVLVETMMGVVQEMRRATDEDHKKMEAAIIRVLKVSEMVEKASGELASEQQRGDSLEQSQGRLASRITDVDGHLREHDRVAEALQEQVRQLDQRLSEEQKLGKEQLATASLRTAQINQRLETIDRALQAQGEAVTQLKALCSKLQDAQQSIDGRLDTQAGAIRVLHRAQDERREEFRVTLQKLGDIAGGFALPEPSPEDL